MSSPLKRNSDGASSDHETPPKKHKANSRISDEEDLDHGRNIEPADSEDASAQSGVEIEFVAKNTRMSDSRDDKDDGDYLKEEDYNDQDDDQEYNYDDQDDEENTDGHTVTGGHVDSSSEQASQQWGSDDGKSGQESAEELEGGTARNSRSGWSGHGNSRARNSWTGDSQTSSYWSNSQAGNSQARNNSARLSAHSYPRGRGMRGGRGSKVPNAGRDTSDPDSSSAFSQEYDTDDSDGSIDPALVRREDLRDLLRQIARGTQRSLPYIFRRMSGFNPYHSVTVVPDSHPRLTPQMANFPNLPPTPIKVVNADTYNAGIELYDAKRKNPRVAVLNNANHKKPGGGWLNGALAQEEILCYRSSLSLSLWADYYPWNQRYCLYSPDVVVMRSDMASGFKWLHGLEPSEDHHFVPKGCEDETESQTEERQKRWGPPAVGAPLAVPEDHKLAVLSVAAVYAPELRKGAGPGRRDLYADPRDRYLTKYKMRLAVRAACTHGNEALVLGALGCGVFRNPKEEVADCWLEVLREDEFKGRLGSVVFAILDNKGDGNIGVFKKVLEGQMVG